MSGHLTVYVMAIEAERPLRIREAELEHLAAQTSAAREQLVAGLLRRLGAALRRSWSRGFAAERYSGAALTIIGQPPS